MDSLLQSFMHDSNNISPPRSNSITPQKSNFFDSGINFREPSPNIFKLNIPEKLNFDSSELFSFRNSELSELDIIACQHYQHSLLVLFIQYYKALLPWKAALLKNKKKNNKTIIAKRFFNRKKLEKAFHGFLLYFVKINNDPYKAVITNFRKVKTMQFILLPKILNAWNQLIHEKD